ncbi:MAG: adenylate/guanylate cyclase domain-containing protein [Dehalococcoidia bacterium]|nr:MAG: adenylate/guanylate cyclase domain-containing protein [Dehalococcoidia bacterium]
MFAKGAKAVQDVKLSPLGNMFGILHIAYALGTVMNRDFIISVPHWLNILYTIVLASIVALLISRGTRFTILAGLVGIVIPIGVGFALFFANIEILTLIPLITNALTLIAGEIYLLLTEEKEKRFIKSTFSSYVNPEVVDILIKHPDKMKLGGDSKELTIMFSDIRGFTSISEGMTPEYLINFLNEYLTGQTDIVMETQGTLDKYIGDAVMAFWGAPIEIADHVLKACQAAVKMMEAVHTFNESRVVHGDKPIDIGIGLNTAIVNVGNVGSSTRKNYTVIGDGVNLASRLEGTNKIYHTNIIISEATYEKVKDYLIVRELDYIAVKGKKEPVKIYELWDVKKWD